VLADVLTELRDPKLPPQQIGRYRAITYAAAVAGHLLELSELDSALETLGERLSRVGLQPGGRLHSWPRAVGGESRET
jgi:hypothetical protein